MTAIYPEWTEVFKVFAINTCALALWYFLLCGVLWLVLYRVGQQRFWNSKVVARLPKNRQVLSEIMLSLRTCAILGVGCTVTWWLAQLGLNQMNWDFSGYSLAWHAISLVLTVILWDAWFYWTHRLMHHPVLFRSFHAAHHRSHNPTPWTVYSLDTWEAITYAVFFPLVAFLYPIHPYIVGMFMTIQFVCNLFLHSGYEISPRWFAKSYASFFISSATSHVMHHHFGNGNYGFCFQYWDKIMGTCHPKYDEQLASICSKPKTGAV